jgi:predicted TIM-barrel fold metal-dependent hydrolase
VKYVDSHMHLWDMTKGDYPWLMNPEKPELPFAKIEDLAVDYRLTEYRRDIADIDLAGFVHVEAAWNPNDPTAETKWLTSSLAESEIPYALVGHANLLKEDFPDVLAEHCSLNERVVGIRQILNFHTDPKYTFTDNPSIMQDKVWRKNFSHLGSRGLSFDLQIFADQSDLAADLARDFPATNMIINHFLMPIKFDEKVFESWKTEMAKLAQYENIAIKLSGLYMYHRNWSKNMLETLIGVALDLFGAERVMWGSNFPVDRQFVTLDKLISDFEEILSEFDQETRESVMWKTANNWYHLNVDKSRPI